MEQSSKTTNSRAKGMPNLTCHKAKDMEFEINIWLRRGFNKCERQALGKESMFFRAESIQESGIWAVKKIEVKEDGVVYIIRSTKDYPIFLIGHHDEDWQEIKSAWLYEPYKDGAPVMCPFGTYGYWTTNPQKLTLMY